MKYVKITFQTLPRVMYAVTSEMKNFLTTSRCNPYLEMTYAEKGDFWVEFANHERILVSEGYFVLFPPYLKYEIGFSDTTVMHTFISIALILDDNPCELVDKEQIQPEKLDRTILVRNESLYLPLYDNYSVDDSVFASMKKLAKTFKKYGDYANITCATMSLEILTEIAKRTLNRLQIEKKSKPSNVYYCDMIDQYLLGHYQEDVTLAEIARQVELHPNYMSNIYKELRGITIMNQLLRLRLEQAKLLLRQRRHMVKDVARMSGFSNFKYFNTVFKRYEGVSPGRYTSSLFHENEQQYSDFLEESKGLH